MADDYEFLFRAAREWARLAATPQYRSMVEAARKSAQDPGLVRLSEQLRAADSRLRPGSVDSVGRSLREVSRAAAALQPALDRHVKSDQSWITAVSRALENEQVLGVLQAWVRFAEIRANAGQPNASGQAVTDEVIEDLAAYEQIANAPEVSDVDLDAFEAEISGVDELNALLDDAAHQYVTLHPFITQQQARRLVVTVTYVLWLGAVIGLTVAGTPLLAAVVAAVSAMGMDAPRVSRAAGEGVDHVPDQVFAPDDGDKGQ